MAKYLVYVVEPEQGVVNFFNKNPYFEAVSLKTDIKDAEIPKPHLVCFTGGHDVTPALYNEKNTSSGNSLDRDLKEMVVYHRFYNTPKVGICRGGQFLNVMNGGSMLQDIEGHAIAGTHLITEHNSGREIEVTSTHHQGIVANRNNGNLLASSEDGVNEVVYYKDTRSLCFQPHPEYGVQSCEKYFFRLIAAVFGMGERG